MAWYSRTTNTQAAYVPSLVDLIHGGGRPVAYRRRRGRERGRRRGRGRSRLREAAEGACGAAPAAAAGDMDRGGGHARGDVAVHVLVDTRQVAHRQIGHARGGRVVSGRCGCCPSLPRPRCRRA
uniref:Uncharacterized protein n=1 Tax=Oryza nivara TaxID=4536 RepID=A0A0E0IAX6_ORYNI